ncbi:MAG: caspase domain-containing protein, partial [Crocinitomicaceae bacterium]
MKFIFVFLCIALFQFNAISQTKDTLRTIINSGVDFNQLAAFSPDNSMIAMTSNAAIEIYDVRTGLLIRKIKFEKLTVPEHLVFENNELLYVSFFHNSEVLKVSLKNGDLDFIQKTEVINPKIHIKVDLMNPQWQQHYNHFIEEKSLEPLYFNSPNRAIKLAVKNNSSNVAWPTFQVSIVEPTPVSIILDSLSHSAFLKVAFSDDSKLVLVNDIVYNLRHKLIVSKIKRISKFGNGATFFKNMNVPLLLCDQGILRLDNFKIINSIESASRLRNTEDHYWVENMDVDSGEKWYSVYDLNSHKENYSAKVDFAEFIQEESKSGKYFILFLDYKTKVVNAENGDIIQEFTMGNHHKSYTFSGDDLIEIEGLNCRKLNIEHNKWIEYKLKSSRLIDKESHQTLLNGGFVLKHDSYNNVAHIWSLENGKLLSKFKVKDPAMFFGHKIKFNLSKGEIVLFKENHNVQIIDFDTGEIKRTFKANNHTLNYSESSDGDLALTYLGFGKTTLWNAKTQTAIVDVFVKNKDNIIIKTPENYYLSRASNGSFVHFSLGKKVFPLEQFDLKYNRPDIVLSRLGYADSSLIKSYYKAYRKRLKKMKFTEEMLEDDFHLPEIKIENFEEMPTIDDQGSINLDLKLKDTKYNLDRINVWVNDVAIYGSDGISLRDKNVKEYTTTLSVNLIKGKNKVQVSTLNQAGAESFKETFSIESTAGKLQPDLYLITIGESEFMQSEYNLTYAAKDANDIAALFADSKIYGTVKTKTITNEQVSVKNVSELKSFLSAADINDQVMIFLAGHGVLDANLDYYFATYGMDFSNPAEKGLAYEDLESLMDGIAPLKKTLIIDACHSGEIDKDELALVASSTQETGDIQFRSVGTSVAPKLGMENTSELTKSLFSDLRKGTGATVISSSGGMEFAMESDEWKNGLFTYCLINGIKSAKA